MLLKCLCDRKTYIFLSICDRKKYNTEVGCHALLQGNLPNPGNEPRSPTLQMDSLLIEPLEKPRKKYKRKKLTEEEVKVQSGREDNDSFLEDITLYPVCYLGVFPHFCSYRPLPTSQGLCNTKASGVGGCEPGKERKGCVKHQTISGFNSDQPLERRLACLYFKNFGPKGIWWSNTRNEQPRMYSINLNKYMPRKGLGVSGPRWQSLATCGVRGTVGLESRSCGSKGRMPWTPTYPESLHPIRSNWGSCFHPIRLSTVSHIIYIVIILITLISMKVSSFQTTSESFVAMLARNCENIHLPRLSLIFIIIP